MIEIWYLNNHTQVSGLLNDYFKLLCIYILVPLSIIEILYLNNHTGEWSP